MHVLIGVFKYLFQVSTRFLRNKCLNFVIKFSEECGPSYITQFPVRFLLRNFFSNFLSLNLAWLPVLPRSILSVFTFPTSWLFLFPFVRFFACLVFFSAGTDTLINLHHFPALCFRMISPFVDWHSPVNVNLLIIQNRTCTHCRNRAWNVVVPLLG